MQPSIWLKNSNGDIWNLRPRKINDSQWESFLNNIAGLGLKTKKTYARINNDFIETKDEPQQVDITGTMLFATPAQMRNFSLFVGDYSNTLRLFYDPEGKIDPRSQIDRPWYKNVNITLMESAEQTTLGLFECKMIFTPLCAMWRRDVQVASTITTPIGTPHVIPFVYPYFYQSERKLYLNILNEGEKIGCRIEIKNNNQTALQKLEWVCTSGKHRQYAKWLEGIGLASGRTLVVDSTPSAQESAVKHDGISDDVQDYQEANPQYINFIELYPGNNQIVFNLGQIEGIDITVSYIEEERLL